MNRLLRLLATAAVLAAAPCAAQVSGKKTPAAQFHALVKEYQGLLDALEKATLAIKGEAQRGEFFAKNYPPPERLYPRFMALAEKHAKEAVAADALIWVVTHASGEPKDTTTQAKALDRLRRDYLASATLPLVFGQADEPFLRAVLAGSPHRHVRGLACYDLAEKRLSRVRTVTRWRAEYPDWRRRWQWLEQTPNAFLLTTDVAQLTGESEPLLERVVREFADVPTSGRRRETTLGELAKGHLHEIRQLAVGKPVSDLTSVDLDGNPVRLADLKGRVVVLDVWATWCGPCLAMIPHQRALVGRLKGKPFTLVSISVDEKRETVAAFRRKEPMPWTHWFNGPDGPIVAALNAWTYPKVYVLDAKGVIRHKDVRGKPLDQAVDALLRELEGKSVPK